MMSPLRPGDQIFDLVRRKTLYVSSMTLVHGRIPVFNEEDNVPELIPVEKLRLGISTNVYQVRRQG